MAIRIDYSATDQEAEKINAIILSLTRLTALMGLICEKLEKSKIINKQEIAQWEEEMQISLKDRPN